MSGESTVTLTLAVTRAGSEICIAAAGPHGQASRTIALTDARIPMTLLDGPVSECVNAHRIKARQAGATLRLSVHVDPGISSASWPIESLRDFISGEDLGLVTDLTIARHDDRWRPACTVQFSAMRVILVAPEPGDIDKFGGDATAIALERELAGLTSAGQGKVTRLNPPTERALDQILRTESCDVVHFIGQGSSRAAARYGTLTLIGSDGRSRPVNAQNFARTVTKNSDVRLVVLQAVSQRKPGEDFDMVTQALMDAGVPAVVWLPDSPDTTVAAVGEFYRNLAAGLPIDVAVSDMRRAFAARGRAPDRQLNPVLFASEKALQTIRAQAPPRAQPATASVPSQMSAQDEAEVRRAEQRERIRQLLDRRRDAGEFDVFLCHNVADKPAVRELGHRLRQQGILPWLDEWELQPGMPWQRLLEQQIGRIRSAVVFVGREGIGPWQRQELDGFLREFANRKCPVIPVLLPGAPAEPGLPLFLEGMTWVDFRMRDPDPLVRLIWGITGQRPQIEASLRT